jgi:hypothetical protein
MPFRFMAMPTIVAIHTIITTIKSASCTSRATRQRGHDHIPRLVWIVPSRLRQ